MARLIYRRPQTAALQGRAIAVANGLRSAVTQNNPVPDFADVTVGPGWFESTFDLWQGLDVREETPVAAWRGAAQFGRGLSSAGVACAA